MGLLSRTTLAKQARIDGVASSPSLSLKPALSVYFTEFMFSGKREFRECVTQRESGCFASASVRNKVDEASDFTVQHAELCFHPSSFHTV